MRVVEPKSFNSIKTKPKKKKSIGVYWFVFAILGVATASGWFLWQRAQPTVAVTKTVVAQKTVQKVEGTQVTSSNLPVKNYTGEQFKNLYHAIAYPNTQTIDEPLPITGNALADARIRKLAEARGYKMTSIPVQSIDKIKGFEEDDNLLQPLAYISWQELKTSAKKDGVSITIISAYRSPEYQRNLFLSRLLSSSVTVEKIVAGKADDAVETTLLITAVPGYSRHHTGYTVDFWCEDGSGTFALSTCYKWLNKDNYKNAKEHGWIPSYPEGANEQGPEPEPWEYVWVGRDTLTQ